MTIINAAATDYYNPRTTYSVSYDGDMVERNGYKGVMAADHPLVVRLAAELGDAVGEILEITTREHTIDCGRCQGTGTLNHYRHVADGECFACEGGGVARYLTTYHVTYVPPADLDAYRAGQAHLKAGPQGGDVIGWLMGGPKMPHPLYAELS